MSTIYKKSILSVYTINEQSEEKNKKIIPLIKASNIFRNTFNKRKAKILY